MCLQGSRAHLVTACALLREAAHHRAQREQALIDRASLQRTGPETSRSAAQTSVQGAAHTSSTRTRWCTSSTAALLMRSEPARSTSVSMPSSAGRSSLTTLLASSSAPGVAGCQAAAGRVRQGRQQGWAAGKLQQQAPATGLLVRWMRRSRCERELAALLRVSLTCTGTTC